MIKKSIYKMGPLLKRAFFIGSLLTLTACSTTKSADWSFQLDQPISSDYAAHLKYLGSSFLNTPGTETIRLSSSSKKYLNDIYSRLVKNNELLLPQNDRPNFNVIKSRIPYYFSLPGSDFYFSTGLIERYLKNEQLLVAMLSAETFKSTNLIYEKNVVVPTGFITIERMLSLVKVPLPVKSEINNNSYLILRRSGYDPSAYLIWLQTQNKNMLDFSLQHGTTRRLSREEYLFKNFIASKKDRFEGIEEKNSSKQFYQFINEIKGQL
ncbi:hypothetical protein [Bacteriovorax sp. BSW11_IV]|uniref:hypothetical protein n=1 Tax=Bacteriovorax sp. BSW11_IV TaxID=1353529 RepID=UPI000412208B|nr:hypothetical protein [Bacteriovorax sp. BSW11_IV]